MRGSCVSCVGRFRRTLLTDGFEDVELGFVWRFELFRNDHRIGHCQCGSHRRIRRRRQRHLYSVGLITILDDIIIRSVASGATTTTTTTTTGFRKPSVMDDGFAARSATSASAATAATASSASSAAGSRLFQFEDVGARLAVFVQVGFRLESESARDARIRTLVGVRPDVFLQDAGLGAGVLTVGTHVTPTCNQPSSH